MIRDKRMVWCAIVPALVFFLLFYGLPVGWFLGLSFTEYVAPAVTGNGPTIETYLSVLSDPYYLGVIGRTLMLGAVVSLISLICAYPLAYLMARSEKWGTFAFLVTVSTMFVNPVASALGLRVMMTDTGVINSFLLGTGVVQSPIPLIGSFAGVAIGLIHAIIPFIVLILTPIIDTVPRDCISAAYGLGASRRYTFMRVVLPISSRGFIPAFLLAFAITSGSFTTVVLLGSGRVGVLSVLIWQETLKNLNYAASAVLAVVLVAIVAVPVFAGVLYEKRMRMKVGRS